MPVKAFECEHCGHAELLVGNVVKNIPKNMVGFPCPACGKKQTGDKAREKIESGVDVDRLLEALFIAVARLEKAGLAFERSVSKIEEVAKKIDSTQQIISTVLANQEVFVRRPQRR